MQDLPSTPLSDPAVPRVPSGCRVYAVGDVHGRADLLAELLHLIAADAASGCQSQRLVLVFLGDYIDRGPGSPEVIGRLLAGAPDAGPLAGAEWVTLRGNHEDTLLHFLDDPGLGAGWFRNGGLETVRAYAGQLPEGGAERPETLRKVLERALPDDHRRFLSRLPLSHCEGGYIFVHAGLRPGVRIEDQDPDDLMWIRDDFIHSAAGFGKVVVHGHTIAPVPEIRPNRIGIDTGAYRTGRLTALVLEESDRRFLATGGPD